MRPLLLALVLALFASTAFAREQDVNLAASPNKHDWVRVTEHGKKRRIYYEVVAAHGDKVLHRLASSYQPEDGTDWNWAWRHSTDAEIRWSPGSRYVAIDEEVHRYIGQVFLVEISGENAREIPIPEKALLERTHLRWDRLRIRTPSEGAAWSSPCLLHLDLAGEVVASTFDGDRHTYEQARFYCTLRVAHGKATIVSMEKRQ